MGRDRRSRQNGSTGIQDRSQTAERQTVRPSLTPPFTKLLDILAHLQEANICYSLLHSRDDAIMVCADVPGQKWEIEVLADGSVEFEVFASDGAMHGDKDLLDYIREFSD